MISPEVTGRIPRERRYVESSANHHKEKFVKTVKKKSVELLRRQELIKN